MSRERAKRITLVPAQEVGLSRLFPFNLYTFLFSIFVLLLCIWFVLCFKHFIIVWFISFSIFRFLNSILQNIEKIKKVVEEGNYYGAQQMYKSFGARYVCQSPFIYLQEKTTTMVLNRCAGVCAHWGRVFMFVYLHLSFANVETFSFFWRKLVFFFWLVADMHQVIGI